MTEKAEGTGEKRLSPVDWAKAAELYELGEASATEIAKRYGVSVSAVSQKFKKLGVVGGSRKHEVAAEVEKTVKETAAEIAKSFATDRLKKIEDTKQQSYQSMQMIHALTHQQIVEARSRGVAFSTTLGNLKALRQAAQIIALTREERYTLLDAHSEVDENTLPVLQFEDLSEVEIQNLQNAETDFSGEILEDEDLMEEGDDL